MAHPNKGPFVCPDCGRASPKWFGRCPDCGAWGSAAGVAGGAAVEFVPLSECGSPPARMASGLVEVDRVLGGGLVRGEVILLAGEPGIGKSTLVLQLLNGLCAGGHDCLVVSAEETAHQVAMRARRVGTNPELRMANTSDLQAVMEVCEKLNPSVLVVDSIQTMAMNSLDHAAGSIAQVRECAAALGRYAKEAGTAVVLTGHVTKDGAVAGPKVLEHLVDAVLALDGERSGPLRFLRATKNRFGSSDELAIFTMTAAGLVAVGDPSVMLLADRPVGVPGSVVFPALEGRRSVLMEIQGLVTEREFAQPRRVAVGVDSRRLALSLAALSEKARISLSRRDVFVAASGGLQIVETAADLALCLAVASAVYQTPIDSEMVVLGEVGLAGEIRRVAHIDRRLKEAGRLGFRRALVPVSAADERDCGINLVAVPDVASAVEVLRSEPARV
ncbi:MAG: DNA repair protein RadA [Actinomycetota bacterium]|nr:DNA repair protein RadA [Actinomycetota bacterium]